MNPMALATTKIGSANNNGGRIGSRALASTTANAAVRTGASAISTSIGGEVHANVVPPRLVSRTIEPSAPASKTAPA